MPPLDAEIAKSSSRFNRFAAHLMHSRWALPGIFALSFLRNMMIPLPLEVVLIPFMLGNRKRVWLVAAITTVGCLLGGSVFYLVGKYLFDAVGPQLLQMLGLTEAYKQFAILFDQHGFWAIVFIGVAPIPYQVATLTSGATGYSYPLFLLASLLSRGTRYFGLAFLVAWQGERVVRLWKRYLARFTVILLALIVLGWLLHIIL